MRFCLSSALPSFGIGEGVVAEVVKTFGIGRCDRSTSRRSAFTLLEVIVGLALMASVLVGSLLSFSAHHQQRRTAESKIAAVAIADQLLNQMAESREGIPATGRGIIAGKPYWFWRTYIAGAANPAQTPLRVIRFQIIEASRNGRMLPLVSVDVVEAIEDE